MLARKMTAADFQHAAEMALYKPQGRCFLVEDSSGRVLARLLTWSEACEQRDALESLMCAA